MFPLQATSAAKVMSSMHPAFNLPYIMRSAHDAAAAQLQSKRRLVSILFAPPEYLSVPQLRDNWARWDAETGESWDLFFAGYYQGRVSRNGPSTLCFSNTKMREIATEVAERGRQSRKSPVRPQPTWRYSGTADLVGVMVNNRTTKWNTLTGVQVADGQARPISGRSLPEIVEMLQYWDDGVSAQFGGTGAQIGPAELTTALRWLSSAIGAGIAGNAVYDLIKSAF